jgi:hypothetical protein
MLLAAGLRAADERPRQGAGQLPAAAPEKMDFQRDIRPIFARACFACHGGGKHKGGLRLDVGSEALKGGDSGVVIKPRDAAHSRLLLLVAGLDADLKMPPRGPGLSTAEIGRLRAWIDQGAVWPTEAGRAIQTSQTTHWAYRQPSRPPVPRVTDAAWARNDIDRFILARLEAEQIAPAPEADRATLIRRLSLDLVGLPPTIEDVDAFLHDTNPEAYDRLVDRLLSSAHYGERWGRHWLDVARYADSDGFEKDSGRPYAWRYRNWVIDALNHDLAFDEFTIEQLAGDLLPHASIEQKVATGFHRNTLTNREGGVDPEQYRVEQVVDRVNTTAKVFLGTTLGCCQCHDHKYDPFTQREYYQMFAFFNSDQEVDVAAPLPGQVEAESRKKAEFDRHLASLTAALAVYEKEVLAANQEKWERGLTPADMKKLPQSIQAILRTDPAKRSAQQKKELRNFYAKTDRKWAELSQAVATFRKTAPSLTLAQTIALGPQRRTHVMIRGDFLRPGVEVEPGTPAVLPPMKTAGKTRLDLARWLVDPSNPLTARVFANWVWAHYFGRGLVATPEDFGTQGDRPSHPELLDYLAAEFVRSHWSMKALHRLIVTSATYRQSSQARPELTARDPLNVLLPRQSRSRLEAEVIRDVALAASGLLNPTIGGPSVHPPQPAGISDLTYAGSARWVEDKGGNRYRRGLYTWFQRTSPYPMLMTFDAPDSNVCVVRRERSDTPLQALTMMNNTIFVECAQGLGRRLAEQGRGAPQERIRYGFRLCLAREPAPAELAILTRLYGEFRETYQGHPEAAAKLLGADKISARSLPEAAAWVGLARSLMNLDEFVTKE